MRQPEAFCCSWHQCLVSVAWDCKPHQPHSILWRRSSTQIGPKLERTDLYPVWVHDFRGRCAVRFRKKRVEIGDSKQKQCVSYIYFIRYADEIEHRYNQPSSPTTAGTPPTSCAEGSLCEYVILTSVFASYLFINSHLCSFFRHTD